MRESEKRRNIDGKRDGKMENPRETELRVGRLKDGYICSTESLHGEGWIVT